jgi:hypothetical protein
MPSPRISFDGDKNALGSSGDAVVHVAAPHGLPFFGGGASGNPSEPGLGQEPEKGGK